MATYADVVDRAFRACSIDGCDGKHVARGWCSKHYQRWQEHGDPEHVPFSHMPSVEERFFPKFQTGRRWECWNWEAGKDWNGYGKITTKSCDETELKEESAHRRFYRKTWGEDIEDLEVDHLCGNTSCVNPWHLESVTHAENMRRTRSKHCRRGHLKEGDNLYINPSSGARQCLACKRLNYKRRSNREYKGTVVQRDGI